MENTKTALLVMDMQSSIVSSLTDPEQVVSNVKKVIKAAKHYQIPVIYVIIGFRQGMPEISAHNKAFSGLKQHMANVI
ncbi:nicotinamidase-related amidase [Chryseobacterium sp. PvR013]|uniref:isochorismatase family protein n=1 Tax=Chryseobacterium sp. PvR013 TaxID=2806595 RepID=UPI001AE4A098|nr:isochorismatase family protein [Chryseobacterium sp. PvR013]MBP1165459.1 nicotinamidase-related amidase [Chryseobacterium sp. PvR013]